MYIFSSLFFLPFLLSFHFQIFFLFSLTFKQRIRVPFYIVARGHGFNPMPSLLEKIKNKKWKMENGKRIAPEL